MNEAAWKLLIVVVAGAVAAAMVIVPVPFVMKMLLPAVSVLATQLEEEPIRSWPFVGATFIPMPPLDVARAFVRVSVVIEEVPALRDVMEEVVRVA